MQSAAPLLECLRVFHSRDADETDKFLGEIGFHFTLNGTRARPALDTRLNGAYLPSLWIGYTQYGAAVTIRPTTRPDYWIQLPLRGSVEVTTGRRIVACDTRTAAAISPTRERTIRTDEGSARLQLSLSAPALVRQLAALLGDWPREPLELDPAIDLTHGFGRSLADCVHLAVRQFDEQRGVRWSSLAIAQYEQLVMTRLLLEHRHSHSTALHRNERSISPRSVKRAIDYIHAHLDAPVTLGDLVALTGIPGRTLLQHFRVFAGVSPIRYLRDQRFERARRDLFRAAPEESVSTIAMRWGFVHMSRFAADYRQRFGETPSATLTSGRRALDPRYARAMRAQGAI